METEKIFSEFGSSFTVYLLCRCWTLLCTNVANHRMKNWKKNEANSNDSRNFWDSVQCRWINRLFSNSSWTLRDWTEWLYHPSIRRESPFEDTASNPWRHECSEIRLLQYTTRVLLVNLHAIFFLTKCCFCDRTDRFLTSFRTLYPATNSKKNLWRKESNRFWIHFFFCLLWEEIISLKNVSNVVVCNSKIELKKSSFEKFPVHFHNRSWTIEVQTLRHKTLWNNSPSEHIVALLSLLLQQYDVTQYICARFCARPKDTPHFMHWTVH